MFNEARGYKLLNTVVIIWLAFAGFGFSRLWSLDNHAGTASHPPVVWRPQPALALDPARPTLVLLLHPQCPCSRASVSELNHLAALCPNRAKIVVLFLRPAGYSASWTRTGLWRQTAAIPGVSVSADNGGEAARRFGAATSGETLLYAPDGHLLFHGGLTGARGHEGDNAGLSAVVALLNGQRSVRASAPVYGCPLGRGCSQTVEQGNL